MKIAIPTENNKPCKHLGHAPEFYFFEVKNKKIISEEIVQAPPHEHGIIPKWLNKNEVNVVLAAGAGQKAVALFNSLNIELLIGVEIKTPGELVADYLNGSLKTGINLCDH